MPEFTQELKSLFEQNGLALTQRQLAEMETYYRELVEVNKIHNLTAVTEPKDAALRHFSTAPRRSDESRKERRWRISAAARGFLSYR